MTAWQFPTQKLAGSRTRLFAWGASLRALAVKVLAFAGIWALFDQALVSGTSFLTTIAVGRFCGKEALGAYVLANSILLFLKGIQDQVIAAPYMIYCGRKSQPQASSYAGSLLVHQLFLCVVVAVVLGFTVQFGQLSSGLLEVLTPLVLVCPIYLMREFVRTFSFAHLKHFSAVLVDLAIATLHLSVLGMLLYQNVLSPALVLMGLGGACSLGVLLWLVSKKQKFDVDWQQVSGDWQRNWSFGRWALASQLLACTMPYLLPWILAVTHGRHETGALGASATITGFANLFVVGLSNYFAPRAAQAFAKGGKTEMLRSLALGGGAFLATLGPITLLMFACGEWAQVTLFGPEYVGSGLIVSILMVALFVNSLGITAGNGLWAMEKPRANFVADVCALIVTIAVTIWLVPRQGSLGAAWATLAGCIAGTIVRGWTLRVHYQQCEALGSGGLTP